MNAPLISVIIPVYNVEPYLRECLDSVVNQTLRDIEIICVNDGSTDNSGAILAEYAARDERIIVITQENRGLSAARNAGIDVAKGKYIYFIDSDDYVDLDALEVVYNKAEELALDVLLFDYTNYADGISVIPTATERKEYGGVYEGVVLLKKLRDDRVYNVAVWILLTRRAFLEREHLRFYNGIIFEDYLFTTELMLRAQRVSHTGRKLYHRRIRPNSITTSPVSAGRIQGYVVGIQELLGYGLQEADEARAAETWRSAVECQNHAKAAFQKLKPQEELHIPFDKAFTEYLYQHFVVDSIKADNAQNKSRKEIERLKAELAAQQRKTAAAKKSAAAARKEISNIHRSATYRIGRAITWLPRMGRGFVRCYRENGWRYTLRRVVVHLRGR